MIVEGIVEKKGMTGFRLKTDMETIPMTTGNMVMFFTLKELAKTGQRVKVEGVMETVMFKRQFVPVRLYEC